MSEATTETAAASPRLSVTLTVRKAEDSLAFYEKAFGFSTRDTVPGPDGSIWHAMMNFHESIVMFSPEGAFGGTGKAPVTLGIQTPVSMYVYCDDVDVLHARAVAAGATSRMAPGDMFWGDRYCCLVDPDGHCWGFAKKLPAGSVPARSC